MKILYFAWIKERVGRSSDEFEVPMNVGNISELIDWLSAKGEEYKFAFSDRDLVKSAINHTHVEHDSSIKEAFEVAFFPPVTGG